MSKIGIPRTLAYFAYYPLWKTFFEELGHQVVLSSPTTRTILDRGVEEAVNDACIPIKIYHGHVADLADQADYIFCPRLVSVRKHGDFGTETFCPKFLGLPDMVRIAIAELPPIIDVRVDLKQGKHALLSACNEVGAILGNNPTAVNRALQSALRIQKKYNQLLTREFMPAEAMAIALGETVDAAPAKDIEAQIKIAVIGYPYAIYDPYINVGLLNLLHKQGVKVYTQDMLTEKVLNRQKRYLPKSMFWYFSNRAVYGGLYYMNQRKVDGIIHVTAFACGPDSMVDRLLEIESHRRQIPYLSIAIDEHTGQAGVSTRIEAFLDMLSYRRDKVEN